MDKYWIIPLCTFIAGFLLSGLMSGMIGRKKPKEVKMADPGSFLHESPRPQSNPPESRPAPESIRRVLGGYQPQDTVEDPVPPQSGTGEVKPE
jgi:hypothetical protein